MYPKTKSTLFSRHSLSVILAFGLVGLIAGVFFLFKPFPAGPGLEVKAKVPEAASAVGWSAYANAPVSVSSAASMPSSAREFALSQQRNFGSSSVSSAASMPSSVREFASSQQRNFAPASVAGWSAYANAPVSVSSAASMPSSAREFALSQQRNFGSSSVSSAASMPSSVREFALSQQRNFAPASVAGWSAYANAPVVVKEAASVVGWSAYANPPIIVKSDDVQKPQNPKSPESLRRR
jgi:hypothetical protein